MVHLNIKKEEQPEMAAAIQAVPDLFQRYLQAEVQLTALLFAAIFSPLQKSN